MLCQESLSNDSRIPCGYVPLRAPPSLHKVDIDIDMDRDKDRDKDSYLYKTY